MKISDAAIAELKLRHPCCDVAAQWVKLRKKGKKFIGPCPLHSRDRSAKDSTSFDCDAERWVCAVCQNGGDVIKLVALYHGLDPRADFLAVVDLLGGVTEPSPERAAELEKERTVRAAQREKEASEYREKERRRAFEIWLAGRAWPGSPVETYLREARGLTVLPPLAPRALRYAPVVAYFDGEETDQITGRKSPRVIHRGPAMLAPIVDDAGVFRGVHVTWIDLAQPKGKALIRDPETGEVLKSKKSYGSIAGNYIPLVEARALAQDAPADLTGNAGEGIETTLSVWAALTLAGRDLSRAWFRSTISLGNLSGRSTESVRHPTEKDAGGKRALRVPGPQPDLGAKAFAVPVGTATVVLLGDGDSDPFRTACALHCGSKRLEAAGIRALVAMAPGGEDFNDRARAGDFAGIVGLVDAAVPIGDPTAAAPIAAVAESPAPVLAAAEKTGPAPLMPPAGSFLGPGELAKILVADAARALPDGKPKRVYEFSRDEPRAAAARSSSRARKKSADAAAETVVPEESDDDVRVDAGAGGPIAPRSFGFSVEDLNREFALVLMGSRAVVFQERKDAPIEDQKRVLSLDAFHAWFANRFTEYRTADGTLRRVTWSKAWVTSHDRRQYSGIEFSPPGDGGELVATPGYLNLWSGFAFASAEKPDPIRYKTFRDHLLTNIAGGDQALFRWVFGFFAHIVQRPRERLGVALVLRGGQGVGKTIVGTIVGGLFPPHYFMVDDPRYVTGQFNAHMATCLLLQADEAVWAGDKAAEGRLKGLITSTIQQIEAKGIDPIRLPNYVRLIMTSNEDWVVPAGKDERRFAVLDVDPRCAQDHNYFKEMVAELENGGYEHLLGALLRFPLDSVDLRKIPRTAALLEQKIRSLASVDAWWYGRLETGSTSRHGADWKREVPCDTLFKDYVGTADEVGIRRKREQTSFGITLRRLVPGLDRQKRVATIDDGHGTSTRRVWCYLLPPLIEAREAFEQQMGQSIAWPLDDSGKETATAPENDVVPL